MFNSKRDTLTYGIVQEDVCQERRGGLWSARSAHSQKCGETEPNLMDCEYTICALLYIPYGHWGKANWDISISLSLQ